jgi:PPM family protein phosphatase
MSYLENALKIVRLSDTGKLRLRNEDAVASDNSIGLALLADGMGGYNAGDVASQIASLTITAELKTRFKHTFDSGQCVDIAQASQHMIEAVNVANHEIYQVSREKVQCAGMGTTLVLCLFIDNKIIVGHIGDSRAYLFREQTLKQITNDHSLLQEQLDCGLLTPEQAKYATYKNFVTKALGIETIVELELNTYDAKVGDIYLLCSDGLSDMLDHEEIESTISESKNNLELAAHALVEKANLYGGKDNISVILIEVLQKFSLEKSTWYKTILKKVVDKG